MDSIVTESQKFATKLLNENLDTAFVYHNIAHTQNVVESVKTLVDLSNLTDSEKEILLISAWFHDVGYTKSIENHEQESANLAKNFLILKNYPSEYIDTVYNTILATKIGFTPKSKLEKIIRDADCAHIGNKNFSEQLELLRKEWEINGTKIYTDAEWLNENINFLATKHRFYTNEAANIWSKRKSKNLSELIKNKKKTDSDEKKLLQKKDELDFKKNKIELPERGIETMFRVTLKNHITLSNIADTKANILLSVNAIIVSLVLSNLIPKLDNPSNKHLIIPTAIFVIVTLASIILSVLATRPNVTSGKFTKEDVANKKVNLLFFGNFHKMKLNDFEWAMGEMMLDKDYLYASMKKDLYFLGLVLNKKYKILRLTYSVFMIGIVISVIAFTIAFQFSNTTI